MIGLRTKFYTIILFSLIFSTKFCEKLVAQNLEKLGKKDMVGVSGGLNFNAIYLNSNNPNSNRDPFSWYMNGNLNISILDWSIPFTYSYSNQHGTYTQPFNQYGVSPTYKWIKVHAGWSNMSFSQYSFSGHPFLGTGVELTPKNWKINLMYGRLKKAIEFDAINESDTEMSFKRIGMGASVGYEKKGYGLNLIWFQAKDDKTSISFIPESTQVQPQENTVISAVGKAPVTKYFSVQAEYALSGFTRNSFADEELSQEAKNKLPYLFKLRTTSQFFTAFKSSLNYNSKLFSCGLNYERIAPDYKTLGIYYANNDFENITLAPQIRLLKSKLNISVNAGLQHNNLNKQKLSTMNRLVGSGNITFQPNQHWNFNASYSNFTSYSKNRPVTDPFYQVSPADTMKFYQLSQNANVAVNHNFGKTKTKHNIAAVASYQVSEQQTGSIESDPTTLLNGNVAYGIQLTESKTSISISANANNTKAVNTNSVFYGPGLNLGKSFNKNIFNVVFSSVYNLSYNNNQKNGSVLNERLNISITPPIKNKKLGKPSISLSASYVTRFKTNANTLKLNEFTGNIVLGYSF